MPLPTVTIISGLEGSPGVGMTTEHKPHKMRGGEPTPNGKLWQFECGCIEGFHPYALYPCRQAREARVKAFGWDWERWSDDNVQNGRHVFRLFGVTVVRTPTIYLGTWGDE